MDRLRYGYSLYGAEHALELVRVEGTDELPFMFGAGRHAKPVNVRTFWIGTTPVTQAFWTHVAGTCPAIKKGDTRPMEDVSWDDLTQHWKFLDQLNAGPVRAQIMEQLAATRGRFRLPTETEWEYAARGGSKWRDGYGWSGSNDVDKVAWYDRRHGDWTQPVAQKAPNQLGIFDMSGNVWEWCQDVHTHDVSVVPENGLAYGGPGDDRVLRGGCFHNGAADCTVSKRYEIGHDYRDGCIGFRLVFSLE